MQCGVHHPAKHGGTFSHCTGVGWVERSFLQLACAKMGFARIENYGQQDLKNVYWNKPIISSENDQAWAAHWPRLVLEVEEGPGEL